jgi:hypothetical protein
MFYPRLTEPEQSRDMTQVWLGYNHNLRCSDGEFYDMKNLTSSYFPLMGNRDRRGALRQLENPQGMIAKDALAYVDDGNLYYNDNQIEGVVLSSGEKQLYSMGAYLLIWPDKYYINTADLSDKGYIENAVYRDAPDVGTQISYSICKQDGEDYGATMIGVTAPTNPENGALWIDTSGDIHALKQWNAQAAMWIEIATVYVKIAAPGIGKGFQKFDGVKISGCAYSGDAAKLAEQIAALNGSHILYACGDDYIVIVGLLDQAYAQTTTATGWVTVTRLVPDMDYITEAENRLWGCKYGVVDGKTVNEIYCCALGDFRNWEQYLGVSTDSWRGSVGSDGVWTGAVTHLGYPVFFKENCLHKVYISSQGAHQITDTQCRGVQRGSEKSLCVVNETLYYKSRVDVCAYDGSLPVSVSDAFGNETFYDAVAGTYGNKYYVSMRDNAGKYTLFVYDTLRGVWHKEDGVKALCFARRGDELYYIDGNTKKLMAENGTDGSPEAAVEWSATTGVIGYEYVDHKYISRFNLRMRLPRGSFADLYIQYDSDTIWHHVGHMDGVGTKTFMLPVRPRRCDHLQLKLEGVGEIRIYSISKILEVGGDAEWE